MVKFYINEKEVCRSDFERQVRIFDIDWRIETMLLNGITCYKKKSPYNRMLKIVIL